MSYMSEQCARERERSARDAAAAYRMAHRVQAVQRWQRVAAWATHRASMAERAAREQR
jgi:hypothetical protein